MTLIRVFTHPTCATCPMAIQMAQQLAAEYPEVTVRIISLGSARGRETAKADRVLSVPTVFVGSKRFIGVPRREDLVEAIRQQRSSRIR